MDRDRPGRGRPGEPGRLPRWAVATLAAVPVAFLAAAAAMLAVHN